MRTRRYQVSGRIEIDAPVERVYAAASDPELVPAYVPEVVRVERVETVAEGVELVRSHLRLGRFTFGMLYRYRYRPPTHYSGVQEGGRLLRGYFSLALRPHGACTLVSHTEGVLSPVPGLARLLGFVYFRLLSRGGVREELELLKRLVERREAAAGGGTVI